MMKRALAALLLVLAVSATLSPQGLAANPDWFHHWFRHCGWFGLGPGGWGGQIGWHGLPPMPPPSPPQRLAADPDWCGRSNGWFDPGHWGGPIGGKMGGHGIPPRPPPSPEMAKCMDALKAAALCIQTSLREECCTALQRVQAACADAKFGQFNPALIDNALKSYCSGGGSGGEAPPSPPSG